MDDKRFLSIPLTIFRCIEVYSFICYFIAIITNKLVLTLLRQGTVNIAVLRLRAKLIVRNIGLNVSETICLNRIHEK